MSCGNDVVPILEVAVVVEALRQHLQSTVLGLPHLLLELSAAPTIIALGLLMTVGIALSCLLLRCACCSFCRLNLALGRRPHGLPTGVGRMAGGQTCFQKGQGVCTLWWSCCCR